jgi:archaellum biogenesis ATPase FlaH
MERKLLRLLLSNSFFTNNRSKLAREFFPAPLDSLYQTITTAHERYARDLTFDEVEELHRSLHPTMTSAAATSIYELIDSLSKLEPIGADVATDVLESMWRKEIGRRIAGAAFELVEGNSTTLSDIESILLEASESFAPDDTGILPVEADLDVILEYMADRDCWSFNIPSLHERCPGGSGGEFMTILARPNVGKTGFWVSLAAGPQGFCDQGALVHALVNEEPAARTMMRAFSARIGMSRDQIIANRSLAKAKLGNLQEKLKIYDNVDLSLEALDAHCKKHKPDIVIIDILDKVKTSGSHDREDMRLKHIYDTAREVGKRNNCFVIGVGQAGAAAIDKSHVTPDMADGSKTGKFGAADIVMGIGTYPNANPEEDMSRIVYVGKNKISGNHGPVTCILNQAISRYEA